MTRARTGARTGGGAATPAAAGGWDAEPPGELDELVVLGAEVTRLRMAARLSSAELADRAGLSSAVVRGYERGTHPLIDLGDLRALATALATTAGALVDAPSPQTHRAPLVLIQLSTIDHPATVWRLTEYLPRQLGQRWELTEQTDPGRTVSRYVLDWAGELLQTPVQVFGSATELTGARSWYIGPPRQPASPRRRA